MALATKCQTPGAQYFTHITDTMGHDATEINVSVQLPFRTLFTSEEAEELEKTIHNALELALAPLFKERQKNE